MAEPAIPPFVMHGARDAVAVGLDHVEQQVTSIEKAITDNPGLAFDLAKTLVESACRSILTERSIAYTDEDDLPRLFKIVTQHLPFLPPELSGEADVRKSLAQTLSGLNTAMQGICELRNRCGFASHGSGSPRPALESVQALLAAEAADAIVGFIYRIHYQDRARVIGSPPAYRDHPGFNDSVDNAYGMIRIFDVEFRPSEVLFQLEPESYRIYLSEFDGENGTPDEV
jgi:hypothetical protein